VVEIPDQITGKVVALGENWDQAERQCFGLVHSFRSRLSASVGSRNAGPPISRTILHWHVRRQSQAMKLGIPLVVRDASHCKTVTLETKQDLHDKSNRTLPQNLVWW
jgi:hypothetical protein